MPCSSIPRCCAQPNHDRHAEAQELLGLAREKNGQTAHAKAEYQRYLALYPDADGAARVRQRLAALLATGRQAEESGDAGRVAATVGERDVRHLTCGASILSSRSTTGAMRISSTRMSR